MENKIQFVIDGKHLSSPYTVEELISISGEEQILQDMEVCNCPLNESSNHCEGDCIRFENSKITGKRLCVGLKDKNGKEIYEGDICIKPYFRGEKTRGVIEYQHGAFVFMSKEDPSLQVVGWSMIKESETEVIGNIYENPELIIK